MQPSLVRVPAISCACCVLRMVTNDADERGHTDKRQDALIIDFKYLPGCDMCGGVSASRSVV